MDFRNKKITVMGLGLLGRGVGVVKFLASKGAKVTVTDLKTSKELKPSVNEIKKFLKNKKGAKPVKFVLGKHRLEDFRSADIIFKAAGVPLDSPFIAEAKKNKIPVFMDDALFVREADCEIIGVTGTRGKTTTANLIYEIAKETGKKVFLAGNIKGTATLPLLEKVKKSDLIVLELSSWQLQGWRDLKISPRIAVVTNIYPDHMNYYKNSMAAYVHDKEAIFANQNKNDFLILNKNCAWCRKFAKRTKGKVIWFSANGVPSGWNLKILGEHNLENIAAAVAVGKILGLPAIKIKKAVEDFRGVPGRLEFVKNIHGVKYYNDTTATMPEATIAALRALGQGLRQAQAINLFPERAKRVEGSSKLKNIILICGGADKNLDFKNLAPAIKKYAKAVVLLNGTATSKLQKQLLITHYSLPVTLVNSMKAAVKEVRKLAQKGDTVLLSPAAASFGMFKNEFDRGEQFLREIRKFK
jgi:UDP-N-acetylmuramoylalanine--D-glutamate ligase